MERGRRDPELVGVGWQMKIAREKLERRRASIGILQRLVSPAPPQAIYVTGKIVRQGVYLRIATRDIGTECGFN